MAAITHIESYIPEKSYLQSEVGELMLKLYSDRKSRQYIKGIYSDSGIDRRHSIIESFEGSSTSFFKQEPSGGYLEPTTAQRNNLFKTHAKQIVRKLSQKTFRNSSDIRPSEITHLITVSCTGFYNPGPDLDIIQALNLSPEIERYHIGFMGCYAAFPALRMAKQFCDANPQANVLIVCLELCTLHFQLNNDLDTLIANSVFSDGAAAAIVSNRETCGPKLSLDKFSSAYLPEGESEMAWDIGDNGFNIRLSKYVPKIIEANIQQILHQAIRGLQDVWSGTTHWAIHPGGKSIVDKVQSSLNLTNQQVQASREVLSNYGNMSSATIMFVLREFVTNKSLTKGEKITALAFGPGLVVESGFLTLE